MRGGAPGNITWRRPGADFPRGARLRGGDTNELIASINAAFQSTPSTPSPSTQPAGIFRKEVHQNSFFLLPTGTASGSRAPPPPPARPVAPLPPPGLSGQYAVPRDPSPGPAVVGCLQRPRSALELSPRRRTARADAAPQLRGQFALCPRARTRGPCPRARTTGFPRPTVWGTGPPAALRASLQLSPLTCSSEVDF